MLLSECFETIGKDLNERWGMGSSLERISQTPSFIWAIFETLSVANALKIAELELSEEPEQHLQKEPKRVAYKLGNPRILKISFHTLRHWKATMEYHRTKDILHVMQMLGHRNVKNTLVYTQLINNEGDDEYICKVAKTVEQAAELIEAGFEYVCEIDGIKLFRKRK